MAQMAGLRGFDRVVQFLQILGVLARSADCRPIASPSFAAAAYLYDQERMNQVFQFLNAHLDEALGLADAARIVGMNQGAFSRFFRRHTGKTFPRFLNELRIGRVCRLLIEDDQSITEVSQECGFTNRSNFNRQFLRLKGASPSAFRQQMKRMLPPALP